MAAGRLGSIDRLHGASGARAFNGVDMDILSGERAPTTGVMMGRFKASGGMAVAMTLLRGV